MLSAADGAKETAAAPDGGADSGSPEKTNDLAIENDGEVEALPDGAPEDHDGDDFEDNGDETKPPVHDRPDTDDGDVDCIRRSLHDVTRCAICNNILCDSISVYMSIGINLINSQGAGPRDA